MLQLGYTFSETIQHNLQTIDELRMRILTTPLIPEVELRMRWSVTIDKIRFGLLLSDISVPKKEIEELLSKQLLIDHAGGHLSKEHQDVVRYKRGLDCIVRDWTGSRSSLNSKALISIHALACPGRFKQSTGQDLKHLLDYLQSTPDHPILQAAIIYIQLLMNEFFTDGNGRIARLGRLLFLYKYSYDMRGFLALDKYIYEDKSAFMDAAQTALDYQNLTKWIEYFTNAIVKQLEEIIKDLSEERLGRNLPDKFWTLSDRQQEIVTLLENPKTTITNKKVQKLFGVSQITASRDLTKLATLGLLFTMGKGRSVHYTRA